MAQTEHLPSVGGPSTLTHAQAAPSSTRQDQSDTPITPAEEVLPRAFGRYELRRLLGRGGMGSVYLAHDAQLDRDVALKIPRPFGDDPNLWRERFLTEARAAATLSHPNICPVHDVGELDGRPFLTMAYVDGETLASKLRIAGRLPVAEAVEIVTAVARAMADAHARGIVHRDLKPGNVMVDRRGRPVVMDFGLALRTDAADDLRVTLTGVALGTPAYMSPEQAGADVDAIGPPADVYALGVMLFELTTGQTPFKGKTFGKLLAQIERDPPPVPSSLNPDIHPGLDGIILTALAKSAADRFPTAAELADVLEQFQAGRHDDLAHRFGAAVTAAHTADQQTRAYPAPPRRRTGWLLPTAAAFFAVLVLLAGVFYVSTDHGDLVVQFVDAEGKPTGKPAVDVKVNGQEVILDPDGKAVRVRAGDNKKLVVTGDDFETVSDSFDLKRNGKSVVTVRLLPKGAVAKKPDPVVPPVPFPKGKTLIELPGWQILADATKDEMQTWLDEKKKADQSVLFLDVCEVAGMPVFSAVVALDDRAPKWKAYLDTPSETFGGADVFERFNPKVEHVAAMSGYRDGKQIRIASLWPQQQIPWNLNPDTDLAGLRRGQGEAREANAVLRGIRPYPVSDNTAIAYFAHKLPGEKAQYLVDVTEAEADEFIRSRREEGERISSYAVYPKNGKLLHAVLSASNPDKRDWQIDRNLTAEQLKLKAVERRKVGFAPQNLTAYAWDGAVRYCMVWVKEPPKPVPYPKDKTIIKQGNFELLLDATKEQMQTWLHEKKKDKHSVLWLDAIEVDKKPLFSAVAALDDRFATWEAVLGVEAARRAPLPEAFKKHFDWYGKFYPVCLSAYRFEGKNYAVGLWYPGDVGFIIGIEEEPAVLKGSLSQVLKNSMALQSLRLHLYDEGVVSYAVNILRKPNRTSEYAREQTSSQIHDFLETQRKQGRRPTSLSAYPMDGELLFAAVVTDDPTRTAWEVDTDISAAALVERTKKQLARGFTPASVTAYPWDGAVRYCVVWVKDPPKPVPYPKDKTLVTQGGYETLLDATKEQMQAWLDERKKAKHSVMWLDCYQVGDKPVFAGVAALDSREPNWFAVLDMPADEYNPGKALDKLVDTKTQHPLSLSGYVREGVVYCAMLWHPGRKFGYSAPDDTEELAMANIEREKKEGRSVRVFRPFSIGQPNPRPAYITEQMLVGNLAYTWKASHAELVKFLDKARADGNRPAAVAASLRDGDLEFAASAWPNPGKWEWATDTGLPADKLADAAKEKAKAGFRPDCVTAYPWDGAVRYCVVWVKDPPKPVKFPKEKTIIELPGWEVLTDATKDDMQTWLDEKKKAKHSVVWLDLVAIDGKPAYTAVAALDSRNPDWSAALDVPANDLTDDKAIAKWVDTRTQRLISAAGFEHEGRVRVALLTAPGDAGWSVRSGYTAAFLDEYAKALKTYDLTVGLLRPHPAGDQITYTVGAFGKGVAKSVSAVGVQGPELAKFLDGHLKAGLRPTSLAATAHKGKVLFSATMAENPSDAVWETHTDLTARALHDTFKEMTERKFAPASLTAYPWDGAVRYCVVWVKDPPRPEKKDPPKEGDPKPGPKK